MLSSASSIPAEPPEAAEQPPRAGLRGVAAVLFMVVLYYGIQLLTRHFELYPHLGLPDHLTERGGWLQAFDHHFLQMVLALVAIGVLGRGRWRDWGLNLDNREESLRILKRFCYFYGVYFVGIGALLQLFVLGTPAIAHPWSVTHILGRLAFGFLFVGLSEEILFRGLIHTYLARFWRHVIVVRGVEMPVAGILATLIFTVAHIGFRLTPFEVTHLRPLQLVQAFVLGLYYSWAYHRTGSLLNPILAHNFSDGALWLAEYLVAGLQMGAPEM